MVAVAQQEGLEPETAATHVIHRVGAGAAEVADGLIGRLGHVDTRQFAGAQEPGDGAGVALVGLERSAGLLGDLGRSSHHTRDVQLLEPRGDDEPAWTRPRRRL